MEIRQEGNRGGFHGIEDVEEHLAREAEHHKETGFPHFNHKCDTPGCWKTWNEGLTSDDNVYDVVVLDGIQEISVHVCHVKNCPFEPAGARKRFCIMHALLETQCAIWVEVPEGEDPRRGEQYISRILIIFCILIIYRVY